MKNFIKRYNNI